MNNPVIDCRRRTDVRIPGPLFQGETTSPFNAIGSTVRQQSRNNVNLISRMKPFLAENRCWKLHGNDVPNIQVYTRQVHDSHLRPVDDGFCPASIRARIAMPGFPTETIHSALSTSGTILS